MRTIEIIKRAEKNYGGMPVGREETLDGPMGGGKLAWWLMMMHMIATAASCQKMSC